MNIAEKLAEFTVDLDYEKIPEDGTGNFKEIHTLTISP